MRQIIASSFVISLAIGCACADTAKLGVLVLDEVSGMPIEGARVRGGFTIRTGWGSVKGSPLPNECFEITDKEGRCKVEGKTDCGEAGASVVGVPTGYYRPLLGEGVDFKRKNLFGVWQPDNIVVTLRVQRVENPIPLFVKKVGDYGINESDEDLFSQANGVLRFDLMKGDWLPPIGKGEVADIGFKRMPREDFGEFVGASGFKGRSFRDSMEVKFLGEDNGLVEMSCPSTARLKIRTAPEMGYARDYLCWAGDNKQLCHEESYNKNRCFCFRIRTRRDVNGKMVEAYYGKIYRDIEMLCGGNPFVPVASVRFTYYINPNNLDRNLEWNKQNLCADPIYPIPQRSRRMEYESFNREQMP